MIKNKAKKLFSYDVVYTTVCSIYILGILVFAILMYATREEFVLLYLPFTFIILLLNPQGKTKLWFGKMKNKVFLLCIIALLVFTAAYLYSQYLPLLTERMGDYNNADYFFSVVVVVLTIVLTWFEYGNAIPVITLLSLFYAYFGEFFPGMLHHAGLPIKRILAISAIEFTCGDGVLGSFPQIGLTWIAIFTIFAGIAFGFGVLEFIINITYTLFKKYRYGIPQIAVISSLIFGSFSGSGAANVAGTGTFTIPLMKRYGIPGHIAGAVESVASTGSQAMPPVMGAAAFLMACYLGLFYWDIVVIGFIPALLFYANLALAVHIYAKQYLNFSGSVEEAEMPKMSKMGMLYDGSPALASIVVLMGILMVFRTDVMIAGFFMIVTFLILTFIMHLIRLHNNMKLLFRDFMKKLLSGARSSAQSTASITTMIACIGIVVAVLIQTGLAQKLSFGIVNLAGDNEILLILLVAVLCIAFGMTATTVAAYILTVTLAAPVLQNMGVPPLITHFTVFYFAMIGLITPPVAPCCAVAAGIATESNFLKISFYAVRIGVPLIILPFTFLAKPAVIIHGPGTLAAVFIILLGILAITLGTNLRYTGFNSLIRKIFYLIIGSLTIFYPHPAAGYVGMLLCAVIVIYECYRLSSVTATLTDTQ